MAQPNSVYDPDADERPQHHAENQDDQALDSRSLQDAEATSSQSGGSAKSDSPSTLKKAEDRSGSGGDDNMHSLYNPNGDKSSKLQKLFKGVGKMPGNKLAIGGIVGGSSSIIVLVMLLVLVAGSLKIPNLVENITASQLARLSRQYVKSAQRVTGESIAVSAVDDSTYAALKNKYATGKAATTFGKLDKYRPGKVIKNLHTQNNLQFTYERGGIGGLGRERLKGVTLNNKTYLAVKPGNGKYVPGLRNVLQFRQDVTLARNFSPALTEALHANKVGPLVRSNVAKQIRKQLGINLIAWKLGNYQGKNEAKARLQAVRDTSATVDKDKKPNSAKTDTLKKAVTETEEAAAKVLADDKELTKAINNGGNSTTIRGTISAALEKTGFQTALGIASPIYSIAVPMCIVYDGSMDSSGPTIDTQTRQQQATFYHLLSAADQQKNGSTRAADADNLALAVGAMNTNLGDTSKSNAFTRASGGAVDTSGSISAEAGAGGNFTLLDATPGMPSSVGTIIENAADTVCPALTDVRVAIGSVVVGLVAKYFTGGASTVPEVAAKQAVTQVIETASKNLAQRLVTKTLAAKGTAGKFLWDTTKSVGKVTAATLVAKLVVNSRAGQLNSGLAQGTDLANQADAGAVIAGGEISRQGDYGRAFAPVEKVQSAMADTRYVASQTAQKSAFDRYLSVSNPTSLVARMAIGLNSNTDGSVALSIFKLAGSLLRPVTSFGSLFSPLNSQARAAAGDNSYGNVIFGWTEAEEDLIDSNDSYLPLENQEILDTSGQEDAINTKYVSCFDNSKSLGEMFADGMIVRDESGNVVNSDKAICSPKELGAENGTYGAQMVFRWRLAHRYNTAIDQLASQEEITAEATPSSPSPPIGAPGGDPIDPNTLYQDSSSIPCAPGTRDMGIQDGYRKKVLVKIHICALPNMKSTGAESNGGFGVKNGNGEALVNARVSGAVYAMVEAAKNDPKGSVTLQALSSFRTMANQQSLCPCDGVRVAVAGTSNHQMGLAIDYSKPGGGFISSSDKAFSWLQTNAAKYGVKNYPAENWHWSATGE